MDSHTEAISANPGLEPLQVAWYSWVIDGLKKTVNQGILTTLVVHVPINEFNDAYDNGNLLYGQKGEKSCVPSENSHIFDEILSLGSTKNIVSGHDHYNNFIISYLGVKFIYATKSGYGSYVDKNLMGCLVFKLNNQNDFDMEGFIYK
jgi:hypothetical protein